MDKINSGRAQLDAFIEAAKGQGIPDASIVELLKTNNWSERDVYAALSSFYERSVGLAIPTRKGLSGRSREAFVYLLIFGTLGVWILALGSLLFDTIERIWPDAVMVSELSEYSRAGTARAVASLLVAFPIYFIATRAITRSLANEPEDGDSPVRNWLTHIALLIAASVVVGDLITFLSYFLRGEITVRFLAKVLTVFILAGGVFTYYLQTLRGRVDNRAFASGAVALVLLGLAAGISSLGSPERQRSLTADTLRVTRLRAIANELSASSGAPPQTLDLVKAPRVDPVTSAPFEYTALDGSRYQLCATFAAEVSVSRNSFWNHKAGRECFTFNIHTGIVP